MPKSLSETMDANAAAALIDGPRCDMVLIPGYAGLLTRGGRHGHVGLMRVRPAALSCLVASCLNDACRHVALINVSAYPAETEVPASAVWSALTLGF
jgi:hypothetical protein